VGVSGTSPPALAWFFLLYRFNIAISTRQPSVLRHASTPAAQVSNQRLAFSESGNYVQVVGKPLLQVQAGTFYVDAARTNRSFLMLS
jgi:hypothetical protein